MKNIVLTENLKINLLNEEKELNLVLEKGSISKLLLEGLNNDNIIHIDIKDDAVLNLSVLATEEVKNLKMDVNVAENASISVYFADFSLNTKNSEVVINLNKRMATALWHLASLSTGKDKKNISVSVYHHATETFARVDNYGVAKDESRLVFAGTSHILNGAIKSNTQQNAKIMVFDPKSDAVAKPILKIDENDIEASHSAAVGKISDEQIFYLTSRGISEEQAKMLITLGYLKPIFKGFDEEEIAKMNDIIGGRL